MKETWKAKKRREDLLDFIGKYQAKHKGRTPSAEQMAKHIGVKATSTVRFHLNRMMMEGKIRQIGSYPFHLKILPPHGQVELPFEEAPTLTHPPEDEIVVTSSGFEIYSGIPKDPCDSNDPEFKEEFDKLAEDREGETIMPTQEAYAEEEEVSFEELAARYAPFARTGDLMVELVNRGYTVRK